MGLALVTKHIVSMPTKGDKGDVELTCCFIGSGVVGTSVIKVSGHTCSERLNRRLDSSFIVRIAAFYYSHKVLLLRH